MKGIKTQWTAAMDEVLIAGLGHRFNADLAQELGVSVRSVIRRYRELNIRRPADFHAATAGRRAERISAGLVGKPNKGQIKPGEHRNRKGEFGHGRVISREARMRGVARGVARRKETFRRERIRERYGLQRLTKLNVNEPTPKAYYRRCYLRKNGYKVERSSYIAYYDENTTRRPNFEAKCRNFEFRQL